MRRFIRPSGRVDHVRHARYALLTIGFWLPVWLWATVRGVLRAKQPYRCSSCGYRLGG